MLHVLIADDHPIVRNGLKKILSEETDVSVIDEAKDGWEVIEKVRQNTYHVVVLDISMPGLSGIDVLKQIKNEFGNLGILMLSIFPEDQYALRVLKAGASGYLTKEAAPNELLRAIKKIARGERYISPRLAEKLAGYISTGGERVLHEGLSDREFSVFKMIASGKTIKEIADELSLSIKTIHTYRTRVLDKMEMKTNSDLTSYALSNGILTHQA
jgi:DNA-binding NarL/FixJ family response regulator